MIVNVFCKCICYATPVIFVKLFNSSMSSKYTCSTTVGTVVRMKIRNSVGNRNGEQVEFYYVRDEEKIE